jgi:capsular polysaccharide biosynthesis protein
LKNDIKHVLIYKGYKETHNFKLINILLSECIFYEVDFDKIYKFKNLVVIRPVFFNILLHTSLIEKLKKNIIEKYAGLYDECKNKNILLMKTHRNTNVMLSATQFNCEDFLSNLENKGYLYIIPEEIDIFKLAIYLLFAKRIVYSTGSILYTNKIFFNYYAKMVYMCLPNQLNICTHKELLDNSLVITTTNKVENFSEIIEQIDNY